MYQATSTYKIVSKICTVDIDTFTVKKLLSIKKGVGDPGFEFHIPKISFGETLLLECFLAASHERGKFKF